MKLKLIPLAILLIVISASCKTVFKSLETPDDVYYSTGTPGGNEVKEDEEEYTDTRSMRMKSRDRRWRDMDDWGYDPYRYGYNNYYYYNPYYFAYPVFGCFSCPSIFQPVRNSTPRMTNLGSYYNPDRQVINTKSGATKTYTGSDRFNNSNNNRGILRGSGSNNASGSEGIRGYSPSRSSVSSGGGSGSPVFRPSKN